MRFELTPPAATRQCSTIKLYTPCLSILQRIRTSILGFKGPCPAIRRGEYIRGRCGIRTHGPLITVSGFQDRCNHPLYQPSLFFVATPRIELEIRPYESPVIPFHHIALVLLSLCNGCRGRRRLLSTFERVTGIEPASKHWKCLIITAIRYSHFRAGEQNRTAVLGLASRCNCHYTTPA